MVNFDTPPSSSLVRVGISGLSVSVTASCVFPKSLWEECLIGVPGRLYRAVGGVEYQLCSFGEGAASEGKCSFYESAPPLSSKWK